jgi:hypothetical protein
MKKIVNLTPHKIVVCTSIEDVIAEYPSEGNARVATSATTIDTVNGIDVVTTVYGEVENLPEPVEGTVYLVSMVVGNFPAIRNRPDVISPDTSPSASIRYPQGYMLNGKDMGGMIFGVTRFTKY